MRQHGLDTIQGTLASGDFSVTISEYRQGSSPVRVCRGCCCLGWGLVMVGYGDEIWPVRYPPIPYHPLGTLSQLPITLMSLVTIQYHTVYLHLHTPADISNYSSSTEIQGQMREKAKDRKRSKPVTDEKEISRKEGERVEEIVRERNCVYVRERDREMYGSITMQNQPEVLP